MNIPFKYGSREVNLHFHADTSRPQHIEPEKNASPELFRKQLNQVLPVNHKAPLDVGIVVADKTRRCQYPVYLPILTEHLLEWGVQSSNICFYIAYGTHAPQGQEESLDCYGESYKEFKFVHHNSRARNGFVKLGETSRGTSVRIAEEPLQKELLISFGAVLHHYFAGFGGGRKLFFPGLGACDSILFNHSLYLDYDHIRSEPACRSGKLEGNPLAEDLKEISGFLPRHLEIHALLNSKKEVCEIQAGWNYDQFRRMCTTYAKHFQWRGPGDFDLVVAGAGGSPRDLNLIQAHKALHHAASFVKDGGKLIFFGACEQGVGNPEWLELFEPGGKTTLMHKLKARYRNNGGTALALMEKSERIHIFMVTEMDEDICNRIGISKCSAEKASVLTENEKGDIAVIEEAALLYR